MKALIRHHDGETVTEDMHVPGIDWNTGMPLTNPVWAGGPYMLVDDYVLEDSDTDFDPTPTRLKAKGAVQAPPTQAPADAPAQDLPADTIVIDGKKYSKEELRSLLE